MDVALCTILGDIDNVERGPGMQCRHCRCDLRTVGEPSSGLGTDGQAILDARYSGHAHHLICVLMAPVIGAPGYDVHLMSQGRQPMSLEICLCTDTTVRGLWWILL